MTRKIFIEGMMCGHCKASVEAALSKIGGVKSVDVSLEDKCATAKLTQSIDEKTLKSAIEEIGFEVSSIEE